ncbi:MAG: hypothetical protein IJM62_02425 [Lachnospiraceae bacterium]|nr:hypothetical protein [Lachnospiraceae bacterium]
MKEDNNYSEAAPEQVPEKKKAGKKKVSPDLKLDIGGTMGTLKDILLNPIAGLRNYIGQGNILVSGIMFIVQCLLGGWFAVRLTKSMLGAAGSLVDGGTTAKILFTYFFILIVTNVVNILAFFLVSIIRKNEKSLFQCVDMAAVKLVVTIPLTLLGIIFSFINYTVGVIFLMLIVGASIAYDASAVVGTARIKSKLPIDVCIIWALSIIVFVIMVKLFGSSAATLAELI